VNGNGMIWKVFTGLLTAVVMFLAGWVWNMERRTTTLEVDAKWRQQAIVEIKADVKMILEELRK